MNCPYCGTKMEPVGGDKAHDIFECVNGTCSVSDVIIIHAAEYRLEVKPETVKETD